jgi:predicted histone-like DNA-binding protein
MKRVSTGELIKTVSSRTGLPKEQVKTILNALTGTILDELRSGNSVMIKGFGTFKPVARKGGKRRNPKTGGTVEVLPKVVMVFKPNNKVKVLKLLK